MAKGDVDYIIKRLNKMTKKGQILKSKSPRLALGELPTSGQVKELKKIMMYKELNRWWKNADIPGILAGAAERARPEIEALRCARAKSRGANQVFY